jgi:lysophospholipase L1-like esterase
MIIKVSRKHCIAVNLDRIVPIAAPLIRRILKSKHALRRIQFESVPRTPGRIVFLGDSITEWTAWEDWFPELRTTNRGISGQAICGVMDRLDSAIVAPKAVSLLIGTNDLHGLGQSSNVNQIAEQLRTLVRRIRAMAPSAPLLINSVMPRSAHFRERIIRLNARYQQIAAETGATYIDLWPALATADGIIKPEMTMDGLHLSVAGYKCWTDILRPHLARFAE